MKDNLNDASVSFFILMFISHDILCFPGLP
jgi:hypothetical protein